MTLKDMLLKEGIVKIKQIGEEPFALNELGNKSRIYFDIKEASLNPKILKEIVNIIKNYEVDNLNFTFNAIGSIAIGGIPISTILSFIYDIPQIIVRNCLHNRGTQSKIIGNCNGKKILFIEDVSVTGDSIIKGIKAIRDSGGICDRCIVIIDRQEGALENCKRNNIILYPLLNKSDFGIKE